MSAVSVAVALPRAAQTKISLYEALLERGIHPISAEKVRAYQQEMLDQECAKYYGFWGRHRLAARYVVFLRSVFFWAFFVSTVWNLFLGSWSAFGISLFAYVTVAGSFTVPYILLGARWPRNLLNATSSGWVRTPVEQYDFYFYRAPVAIDEVRAKVRGLGAPLTVEHYKRDPFLLIGNRKTGRHYIAYWDAPGFTP